MPALVNARGARALDRLIAADEDALAWISFATLAIVAVLGWAMFAVWRRPAARFAEVTVHVASDMRPEDHFPKVVIGFHGLLAVTTVVLVVLTAIVVGGS